MDIPKFCLLGFHTTMKEAQFQTEKVPGELNRANVKHCLKTFHLLLKINNYVLVSKYSALPMYVAGDETKSTIHTTQVLQKYSKKDPMKCELCRLLLTYILANIQMCTHMH